MTERWLAGVCFFLFLLTTGLRADTDPLDSIGRSARDVPTEGSEVEFKAPVAKAKDKVRIVRLTDGSVGVIVERLGEGTDRLLTANEFVELLYRERTGGNWLVRIFNVTSPEGIAWVILGLAGQLIFAGRMIIQWLVSEKERRSVIPVSFWWMSVVGSTMLLVYFIWRRDIVGILGQGMGWVIYLRNLLLIHRSRHDLPSGEKHAK